MLHCRATLSLAVSHENRRQVMPPVRGFFLRGDGGNRNGSARLLSLTQTIFLPKERKRKPSFTRSFL